MHKFPFLFASLIWVALSGCTTAALTSDGSNVVIVDTFSASDMLNYEHIADLKCTAMLSVEDCRNDLRNQGAGKGATIVRLTSTAPDYCALDALVKDATKKCFDAYGDAFKPKAK